MTRTAACYLRKSRSDDPTREVSREVQDAAVRGLAERDGIDPDTLVQYVDWDRSADESKAARRVAFRRLLRAIEAGDHSVVYAYVPDRLYRGLESYVQITTAAARTGTRIVTTKGEVGGSDDPNAEFQAGLGALLGRLELSTAKQRASAAYRARVRRGDHVGQAPYGWKLGKDADGRVVLIPDPDRPVEPIIEAFRRAGGRTRTAVRIINDELHLPSPYGREWDRPTLLRVIAREAPELLPRRGPSGRRVGPADIVPESRGDYAPPVLFAKLLTCHCGRTMTPNRATKGNGRISYYCARGNASPKTHGPYWIAESKVLPWIKAEAARLRHDIGSVDMGDADARRTAIEERRDRANDLYIEGRIDRDRYAAEMKRADRDLEELDAIVTASAKVPAAVDWTWPVESINDVLRVMWSHVALGPDLMPVAAAWRSSEWIDDAEAAAG